jgi:hypothetical protein
MSLGALSTVEGIDRVAEIYPALVARALGRAAASTAAD